MSRSRCQSTVVPDDVACDEGRVARVSGQVTRYGWHTLTRTCHAQALDLRSLDTWFADTRAPAFWTVGDGRGGGGAGGVGGGAAVHRIVRGPAPGDLDLVPQGFAELAVRVVQPAATCGITLAQDNRGCGSNSREIVVPPDQPRSPTAQARFRMTLACVYAYFSVKTTGTRSVGTRRPSSPSG